MDYPKISIVTPSFNQGQFIEETIDSVLSQGYPNLEYIIIDGGSADNSVEVIKKYEKYLTYWVSEKDKGHGDALNKGFKKSTGEIMAWLNSDDKYYPWTLNVVSDIFKEFKDIKWIQGVPSFFKETGYQFKIKQYNFKNVYDFLLGKYAWIQQESTFWHRDLWITSGAYIDNSFRFMVDGELWTRFFLTEELWHVDAVIGGLRQHGNRRATIYEELVHQEMDKCIESLKKKLPKATLTLYNKLKKIEEEKELVESKLAIFDRNKVFKILPVYLYNKIRNRYAMLLKNNISILSSGDKNKINYRKIIYNNKWIKLDF